MGLFNRIQNSIAEILDLEPEEVQPQSYMVRDLGADSIDLLEVSVNLSSDFNIQVHDDEIFLSSLRLHIKKGDDLAQAYPALSQERINEILGDLEGGPTLKVCDLISYMEHYT